MSHTHHKWPCPKSNGRHEWEIDLPKYYNSVKEFPWADRYRIGIPVKCIHGCGAYGTEWYKFEELIEGE